VRVSRFAAPSTSEPATGDRTLPTTWIWQPEFKAAARRDSVQANWNGRRWPRVLSEYRPFLGADHEVKFGAQVEKGQNSGWTAFQGGVVSYTDNAGQPVQAAFRQPAISGGEFITTGLYVTDSVRFADRFTASLGLRFDHASAISPDLLRMMLRETRPERPSWSSALCIRGMSSRHASASRRGSPPMEGRYSERAMVVFIKGFSPESRLPCIPD
jgi:outer membrane receptor protein involved in Fe transport